MHYRAHRRTAVDKKVENLCQRLVMSRIYGFDYRRVRYARARDFVWVNRDPPRLLSFSLPIFFSSFFSSLPSHLLIRSRIELSHSRPVSVHCLLPGPRIICLYLRLDPLRLTSPGVISLLQRRVGFTTDRPRCA